MKNWKVVWHPRQGRKHVAITKLMTLGKAIEYGRMSSQVLVVKHRGIFKGLTIIMRNGKIRGFRR